MIVNGDGQGFASFCKMIKNSIPHRQMKKKKKKKSLTITITISNTLNFVSIVLIDIQILFIQLVVF